MAVSRQSQGVPTTTAILRLRIVGTKSKHFLRKGQMNRHTSTLVQRAQRSACVATLLCGYTRFTHVSLGLGDPPCARVGLWLCGRLDVRVAQDVSRASPRCEDNRSRPDLGLMRDQGGRIEADLKLLTLPRP